MHAIALHWLRTPFPPLYPLLAGLAIEAANTQSDLRPVLERWDVRDVFLAGAGAAVVFG
jgi:hypothetical protein